MGSTASLLIDPAAAAEPLTKTVQMLIARAEARKQRHQAPRKVFFCHSCCAFSYDSHFNDHSTDAALFTCPHPFCVPHVSRLLEEIPASIEGSLRLQAIMLDLINARAAARERSQASKVGVPTVDVVLGIDIVKSQSELIGEQTCCSICNDEYKCGGCSGEDSLSPSQEDTIMKLECGHGFHESCIMHWFEAHRTCPCCRSNVTQFKAIPTAEQLAETFDEEQLSTKVRFALRTKSFRVCEEVEAALMTDKKEDNLLRRSSYTQGTVPAPRPFTETGPSRRGELSERLYGLLVKSNSARGDTSNIHFS